MTESSQMIKINFRTMKAKQGSMENISLQSHAHGWSDTRTNAPK